MASGEIDFSSGPGFREGMRAATDEAIDHAVIVDCAAVTFMDTGAYHALVEASRYARQRGHHLVVRNLRPTCTRVLDLCDWDQELTYEGSSP